MIRIPSVLTKMPRDEHRIYITIFREIKTLIPATTRSGLCTQLAAKEATHGRSCDCGAFHLTQQNDHWSQVVPMSTEAVCLWPQASTGTIDRCWPRRKGQQSTTPDTRDHLTSVVRPAAPASIYRTRQQYRPGRPATSVATSAPPSASLGWLRSERPSALTRNSSSKTPLLLVVSTNQSSFELCWCFPLSDTTWHLRSRASPLHKSGFKFPLAGGTLWLWHLLPPPLLLPPFVKHLSAGPTP